MQYGDIIKLDIGVIKDGWVGDTAKTVPVGIITPQIQRLLQVTEEALDLCIPLVREGKRLHDVSGAHRILRDTQRVTRWCASSSGMAWGGILHEEPQVPNYRSGPNPKLKAG